MKPYLFATCIQWLSSKEGIIIILYCVLHTGVIALWSSVLQRREVQRIARRWYSSVQCRTAVHSTTAKGFSGESYSAVQACIK